MASPPATPLIRPMRQEDGANWVRLLDAMDPGQRTEDHAAHVARYFWTGSREAMAYLAEWEHASIGSPAALGFTLAPPVAWLHKPLGT